MEDITTNKTSSFESMEDMEKRARDIACIGDYHEIVSRLSDEGLLYDQVIRVKGLLDGDIDFLDDEDFQMLTVLELYDVVTFEHSLKTYLIARDKVEKVLDGGIVIADFIESEKLSLEQFYRACLLHDIGKVEIPKSVLEVSQEHWDKPVNRILNEIDLKEIESRGFDGEDSFSEIMQNHEVFSENKLRERGLFIEAELAGRHHNYNGKSMDELRLPLSTSALSISLNLADVMHLADVQQALEQKRQYRESMPKLKILAILISHAEKGFVDKYITYLWVKDEMANISDGDINDSNMEKHISFIESFLSNYDKF